MKVTYNSPVVLTFALICFVLVLFSLYVKNVMGYLATPPHFSWARPGDYLNMFTYVFAHSVEGRFDHFFGNFAIILLVGPAVEEKHGSKELIIMMLITTFVTSFLNAVIFHDAIVGASGLALMIIILSTFTNHKKGEIPLTFIIIFAFLLGRELIGSFSADRISQFAHIVGGLSGGIFGFYFNKR